jgi:hypothetical protein
VGHKDQNSLAIGARIIGLRTGNDLHSRGRIFKQSSLGKGPFALTGYDHRLAPEGEKGGKGVHIYKSIYIFGRRST